MGLPFTRVAGVTGSARRNLVVRVHPGVLKLAGREATHDGLSRGNRSGR